MKTKDNKPMGNGHKPTELVMQTGMELLPLIMNNIPQAVFWKDRNLVYLGCNQAFADDAGYSSPAEVVGKTDFDMPWKAQAELYRADDSAVMEKGEPKINYEEPQTTPSGSTIWLSTSKIPVRENGQIVAVLGMYEDITARKQVEKDLLLRDRALASSLNAVVILNLQDSKPIYVNDALLKMTGYTREEAMHIGLSDITGNLAAPKEIRAAIQNQGFFVGEEIIKRKDGSAFPANFFSTLIMDDKGQPFAVQSTFFDITERQQAEEAVRASEERFKRFTEATVEGLVFHEQGKIIDVNPAAIAIFGLTNIEELIGKNLLEFIVPEYHQTVLKQMQLESVAPYEIRGIRKDGSTVAIETSTRAYKDGDRVIRASSIRDITERNKAEESIRIFQAMAEASTDAIFMADPNTTELLYANAAALQVYQMPKMVGSLGVKLWPEESVSYLQEVALPQIMDKGWKGQAPQVRGDGSIFNTDVTAFTLRDATNTPTHLVVMVRDITERKRAEQKLQENQQLLQLVMDNIPQSVFWKDKESLRYMGVNQAFAEDAGFASSQELVGKDDFDMPWKEQAELYRADDQQVLELGEPKLNYEEPQTGPTGQVTWLRTSKIPMRDANGQIFAVLGMYEDITGQKQLQQQVQESFERRGYQVQVSTEVSQEIAAATETNELFDRVVKLTRERFGYYHTQLLRYDSAQDAVVLINGYGETGRRMLEGGHKMPMGEGLIGTAAATGKTLMRPTLADDPDWHPNPLLPETKGEIAVPIKWQDKVLGVLDVQSDKAGALTEDDRLLLEGLCGQIAIAMNSAELVETIRENEARLGEALRIARLGNWEYDFENDLFHFTDDFYAIFRTTAEKVGGYKISSADYAKHFVHPDDAPMVDTEIQKVINAKDRLFTTHLEHRMIFADGEVGYISVNINVERDENGKITRWYGANQDITERKLAETALRESELRYQQILDAITDMILVKGEKSSIVWANKAFRDYYGMTNEQLRDMIDAPIVEPDYTLQYIKDDAQVFESGEILVIPEEPVTRHDGVTRPFETFKAPIRDLSGNVIMTVGVSRDITERKKEQEALAERLDEINRLYQELSREGWKTYRATSDLPTGFMFDQSGIKPVENASLSDKPFANIPMKVLGGEVVGSLAVADDPQHPISKEDLAFLQQVSDQIALALEGARLSAQTQSALAQSEILFEASRRLAQSPDLQELLKAAIETFNIPVINGAELNMFNYNSEGELESLNVVANWWSGFGKEPGAVGSSYPKAIFPSVNLFLTPTPLFISDALDSERVDASMSRIVKAFNIRAVTFLPLYVGTRQVGVLVMHAEEPHEFSEEETRLFSGLAPQIATVLENRRQFERARQQAERESMLNTISQKIQSATTVEAVLQIAARELGHALGAPMTIAQLSMKDKK